MRRFAATAVNEQGLTFRFAFLAHNWAGITEVARARLDEVVAGDPMHAKYAPWHPTAIDGAA
jgi:hypothetical protein